MIPPSIGKPGGNGGACGGGGLGAAKPRLLTHKTTHIIFNLKESIFIGRKSKKKNYVSKFFRLIFV